ncbi:unnamed protein product [Merluccius merluccius]
MNVHMGLLWIWILCLGCSAQAPPEEVELFSSIKQSQSQWISEPRNEWTPTPLSLNSEKYTSYQGCLPGRRLRTLLSPWVDRADAHQLLLDIRLALGQEPSGPVEPLYVQLVASDSRLYGVPRVPRYRVPPAGWPFLAAKPFPETVRPNQLQYVSRNVSFPLGSVTTKGFHLGISYSGTCAYLLSVRLYYRRCPGFVAGLARFEGAAAGSEEGRQGSCVDGAAGDPEEPPEALCLADGVWGRPHGRCVCSPGHEEVGDTCTACRMGYYKPANESGGCLQCPPQSGTAQQGAEGCDCLDGFDRLPSDPRLQGCTRPPSAPVNLMVHRHDNALLRVQWQPPSDLGGRPAAELTYGVSCSQKGGEAGQRWEACEGEVIFSPSAAGLTGTEVNVTGLSGLHDYRLSVRATNALSARQGAENSSEATVNVHTREVIPIVTNVPVSKITETSFVPDQSHAIPPHGESRSSSWWFTGGIAGCLLLLLLAVVLAAVFTLRSARTKPTPSQEVELMPWAPRQTFRVLEEQPESRPDQGSVVLHEFQGLGAHEDPLLANLRDTLVDRSRLTLGKELGKGEFGSVCEGILTSEDGVDVKVAVKSIKALLLMPPGLHSQEDTRQFIKEAEIMKSFDHENVVRLLGVSLESMEGSSVPLVILPFMKHGDLRQFLITTRYGVVPIFVPHQSLLRFMVDIAAGMQYLSSQGFLHRDLAARNCMIGDSLRVCVADFGLAKKIESSSDYYRQLTTTRVPFKWMATESLSENMFTTKSDVWSFGVTMWEIVSRGRVPYPGVQNHELLDLLTRGQRLQMPKDCDAKLYETMLTCWHPDPAQRPDFAELGSRLKEQLSLLPPLEAFEEAHYINQGLEAAAAAAAAAAEPGSGDGEETEETPSLNVYTAAPRVSLQEDNLDESGYLLNTACGSAAKRDHKR